MIKTFRMAFVLILVAPALVAGELDIARQALRDGLWDVVRTHAARIEGDDAKQLILESYCREGRWDDALKTLNAWTVEDSPVFRYYHALTLFKTGHPREADALLSLASFPDESSAALASRLKARIALAEGRSAEALRIVKETGFAEKDAESRLAAAEIFAATGDHVAAQRLWQEVAADTNVTERVFVTAALNLSNPDLLRVAYEKTTDAKSRRLVGLRLGLRLIEKQETFEEGASLIRAIAKDAPDAEGARDAFVSVADTLLSAKRWQEASDTFRQALEIWPPLALQSSVQEGRGWAFRMLGKREAAIEAFSRAEETATNDTVRAIALIEQGDVLSENGQGEEALAKYRLVLERYPQTSAGAKLKAVVQLRELEAKGREYYRNYEFAKAQEIFAQVAEKDPSRKSRMEYYTVLCLYGQGLDREAFTRASALTDEKVDPSIRAEATLWLAKFSYNHRRWKESQRLFAVYAEMRPKSPEAPSSLTWSARAAYADNDFERAIQTVARLAELYPDSPEKARGYLIQGEALIELARFDEAVLVLDRTIAAPDTPPEERLRAQILRADALFAMGADNPVRYREALSAYQSIRLSEKLSPSLKLAIAFKTGRTLEKLKRLDEAIDHYYASVVLAYREGRMKGVRFDDEARATFARAAFRLADEYESRGKDFQAMHILELVVASDVPASDEAEKRIDRIQTKGKFL